MCIQKTIVTCSTRRKEHAGRWNFAPAPSEAKLSVITAFRHFSALDLTSEVTGWPRTLSLYIYLFISRRATRSFFPRSSSSIRGETARGVSYPPPPLCRNGLCRRGLTMQMRTARLSLSTENLWSQSPVPKTSKRQKVKMFLFRPDFNLTCDLNLKFT